MDETMMSPLAPRTVAEYKTAIAGMLAEMNRLNEQMRRDQVEIDRLKAEATALQAETRVLLFDMGATV